MPLARDARELLAQDEARSARVALARQREGTPNREARSNTTNFSSPADWLLQALGGGSKSGAAVNEATALTISTFYACVGIIADMVGKLPCKLYRKNAAGRDEVNPGEHAVADLLAYTPDGERTPFEFRRFVQGCAIMRGNGYARIHRDRRYYEPQEIEALDPAQIETRIMEDRTTGRRRMQYILTGSRGQPLTRADLLHIPAFSLDGFTGVSAVRAMCDTLGNAISQRDHTAKTFSNGAKFPGFLTTPTGLTPDQVKQIAAAWQLAQGGVDNAGKTPVLHGGLDYKAVGMNNADAELIASRQLTAGDIATFFRIPPHLVGLTEKSSSWGSGIEQQTQGFLNFSLDPWLVTWEQSLSLSLLTLADRKAGYFIKFNRNALMQTAAKDRGDYYRVMRDIGALSINDIRAREELNDLPDNIGDNYQQPFNGSGGAAPAAVPADAGAQQ
jgi:HK97 family phage portal protein